GELLAVQWTVLNQGSAETLQSSWTDRVYLSDQPALHASGAVEWFLGEIPHQGALNSGESYTVDQTFVLTPPASGRFVLVETNAPPRAAFEGPFTNNSVTTADADVTARPVADLVVTAIQPPPQAFSGETIPLTWTVQNVGAPMWEGTRFWTDQVFISTD